MTNSFYSQWKHIPEIEINDFGHVDHQNYVDWMNEVSQQHFDSLGFSRQYFVNLEEFFVVRRHSVEYLSPCSLYDRVAMTTWVSELGNKVLKRQHRIFRLDDSGDMLPAARGESLSVYVDKSIKPIAIPNEISAQIELAVEGQLSEFVLKLEPPPALSLVGS